MNKRDVRIRFLALVTYFPFRMLVELQTHSVLKFLPMPGEFCSLNTEYAVLTGLRGDLV